MSKNIKVKPGKAQSMASFITGLVFCAIGMFIAIPTAGLFGVFWTLIAVVITVINGKNAFSDEGIATHEIVIEDEKDDAGYVTGVTKGSAEERLKKVDDLYQKGLISSEEREQKRKEILGEI